MGLNRDQSRLEMIAEVARLYHEENYNLAKIGRKFGISASTVSRLLKEARELKIAQVVIRYPFLTIPSMGKALKEQLGLRAAYVLPEYRGSYTEVVGKVGQLAARVLEEALRDGMTLGISLGMAVSETAKAFRATTDLHCRVLRLQGANKDELAEGTDLAQLFSLQLGNDYKIIPSPWIMSSREACESILQEPAVRDVIREAESADIALVGMGTMEPSASTLLRNKLITLAELESLRRLGAAGEICGKHFDRNGNVMDVEFNRRSVAVDISRLRKIETVIGVAAGASKVRAMAAAIRGKLINVLVTDQETAKSLLNETSNP